MRLFNLLPFLLPLASLAQVQPTLGGFMFSNGVHPTLDVTYENTDTRTVENFWKSDIKGISTSITNKKELIGVAARIPAVSPDTLRIFFKTEQAKGSTSVIAHIAFLSTSGFVGPDAPERELTACTEYVRQRAVTLKRQIAQGALDKGEHDLAKLQGDLDQLKREKMRTEGTIEKTKQKDEQAVKDKADADAELAKMPAALAPLEKDAADQPSKENTEALKDKQKEQAKLQDKSRRLEETSVNAKKKVTDLEWEIKKNLQDQDAKTAQIQKQQTLVDQLREKLGAIQ